jgi:hypothetical protein
VLYSAELWTIEVPKSCVVLGPALGAVLVVGACLPYVYVSTQVRTLGLPYGGASRGVDVLQLLAAAAADPKKFQSGPKKKSPSPTFGGIYPASIDPVEAPFHCISRTLPWPCC